MKDEITEVGPNNGIQIITDNVVVCKAAGMLIELEFPSIYWTLCVMHTLNLVLKNICVAKKRKRIMLLMINVLGSHKLLMMLPLLKILLLGILCGYQCSITSTY